MADILINVIDQELFFIEKPKIAAEGEKENYVVFTFDDTWTDFEKTAVFTFDPREDQYYAPVDSSGRALVPDELTAEPGKIFIGVYGIKDGVYHTSTLVKYRIVKGVKP